MTSRREFVQAGLAVAALPVAAQAAFAMAPASVPLVSLYRVLYDTRFPACIAFARRAAARGLAVHAMAGDMTRFWYDDLYYRWRQEPVAIAGLTAEGALFCLERLAWDQRMRVIYRGEHSPMAGGGVAHRFEGPEPLLPAEAEAAVAEAGWAGALADIVAECPRSRLPSSALQAVTPQAATAAPSEALFSWVIAPVLRS